MAAAYATLSPADVPRATTALNVLQRCGGAIGTALLTVALTRALDDRGYSGSVGEHSPVGTVPPQVADGLAGAFGDAFTWAVVITVVSVIPAVVERRARRARAAGGGPVSPVERATAAAVNEL
jgi:hypothetical protein